MNQKNNYQGYSRNQTQVFCVAIKCSTAEPHQVSKLVLKKKKKNYACVMLVKCQLWLHCWLSNFINSTYVLLQYRGHVGLSTEIGPHSTSQGHHPPKHKATRRILLLASLHNCLYKGYLTYLVENKRSIYTTYTQK